MKSKYINPFTDYGFKKLFGEEGSKKLLINFLNDILPIKDKIKELNFQKNEQQGDSDASRKAIYDLFCEDEKGNQFIVEMQNAKQTYFKDRAVFYTTFPIRDQAQKGDWDFKLKAVYCVGLLGFEFEKNEVTHVYEDKKTTIEEEWYYNNIQLKNQRNKVFYDKLTFVFIELPKFKKLESDLNSHFEKWLYFLKNLDQFDKIPNILKEEIFEEAFKIAEIANYNLEEVKQYEDSLKNYRDNINVITTAKKEGMEEGMEKGMEKEKEQNRLKDIEIVLKLLVKKFKVIDSILEKRIRTANSEKLNAIIEGILDIENLADIWSLLSL